MKIEERVKQYMSLLQVDYNELFSSSRTSDLIDVRHLIWYMLRKDGFKSIEIANHFDKCHSTIIYGAAHILALLDIKDKKILVLYNKISHLSTCR